MWTEAITNDSAKPGIGRKFSNFSIFTPGTYAQIGVTRQSPPEMAGSVCNRRFQPPERLLSKLVVHVKLLLVQ
jgi:hypothetical protein